MTREEEEIHTTSHLAAPPPTDYNGKPRSDAPYRFQDLCLHAYFIVGTCGFHPTLYVKGLYTHPKLPFIQAYLEYSHQPHHHHITPHSSTEIPSISASFMLILPHAPSLQSFTTYLQPNMALQFFLSHLIHIEQPH